MGDSIETIESLLPAHIKRAPVFRAFRQDWTTCLNNLVRLVAQVPEEHVNADVHDSFQHDLFLDFNRFFSEYFVKSDNKIDYCEPEECSLEDIQVMVESYVESAPVVSEDSNQNGSSLWSSAKNAAMRPASPRWPQLSQLKSLGLELTAKLSCRAPSSCRDPTSPSESQLTQLKDQAAELRRSMMTSPFLPCPTTPKCRASKSAAIVGNILKSFRQCNTMSMAVAGFEDHRTPSASPRDHRTPSTSPRDHRTPSTSPRDHRTAAGDHRTAM